jgi:Putative sensor
MNATARGRSRADGAAARRAGGIASDTRLRLYRNPVRLVFSAGPWRAAWYLSGYVFVTGWLLFAATFTATVTAAVFAITLAGIPLLVAASAVLRGCADVERVRLRQVLTAPARGGYRAVTRPGVMAQLKTRWQDPATWRDVAYLIGLWVPLFILDTVVLTVWLTLLAGITLPAWYWAPWQDIHGKTYHGYQLGYFPNGPHGHPGYGLYVDTLPKALLAAAVFAVLFLLFNYVVVITARAHAATARSVLRAPADPLAEAKEVLAGPGPLGPLIDRTQNEGAPVGHPS